VEGRVVALCCGVVSARRSSDCLTRLGRSDFDGSSTSGGRLDRAFFSIAKEEVISH